MKTWKERSNVWDKLDAIWYFWMLDNHSYMIFRCSSRCLAIWYLWILATQNGCLGSDQHIVTPEQIESSWIFTKIQWWFTLRNLFGERERYIYIIKLYSWYIYIIIYKKTYFPSNSHWLPMIFPSFQLHFVARGLSEQGLMVILACGNGYRLINGLV